METKRSQVIQALKNKDYKKALKIAKTFRIELNKEQNSIVTRGYESLTNPRFYKSLGQNIEQNIQDAIDILLLVYKKEVANG